MSKPALRILAKSILVLVLVAYISLLIWQTGWLAPIILIGVVGFAFSVTWAIQYLVENK